MDDTVSVIALRIAAHTYNYKHNLSVENDIEGCAQKSLLIILQ